MVIRSLKPFAANSLVIYGDTSISHMATVRAAHYSHFLNPLAQPLLAFSTTLMEIITTMSVVIKQRVDDVIVPRYDNLNLKLDGFCASTLDKLTACAEARKHFEILFRTFRR